MRFIAIPGSTYNDKLSVLQVDADQWPLRALGVDPAEASDRGHPVKQPEESLPDLVA